MEALRVKAERLRRAGDLAGAFEAYEQAIAAAPRDLELLKTLAELAGELEMHDLAIGFWAHLSGLDPTGREVADGHTRALIAAARFAEAIEVLKSALGAHPGEPRLWTTLGLALTYAGRAGEALTFFDESIRLDPRLPAAVHNRALALCDLARLAEAEADFRTALSLSRQASERATIEFSLATLALGRGDLAAGWPLYESRLSPDSPKYVAFQGIGRRLAEGDLLAGRGVLVLGEQGVGDEIMFAGLLPDLIEEVGPSGRIVLAVERRLTGLFQRSFPSVEVCAHATPRVGTQATRRPKTPVSGRIDFWTPLASLAGRYRRTVADFPRMPFLKAEPARVRRWRAWLGSDRPAIGITWRSGAPAVERQRFSPGLGQWTGLLRTPGAQVVNIQYGDCAADLAELARVSTVEILQPPGLNIREDLDDLAALCSALDAVVGIPNATTALAGACGTSTVFLFGPGAWPPLGEARLPWYSDARICLTDSFADWAPAMKAAAGEIGRIIAADPRAP